MKKNEKKQKDENKEKANGAIILGILLGIFVSAILTFLTNQLMWLPLGTAMGLMIGVIVSSFLNNKDK